MTIRTAVIPVAGLGTRFLPATKAIPKEMLPVVDKPAIQYVVEEAVAAGVSNLLLVTGRNKGSLEDHFDKAWELEYALAAKGDLVRLERVRESNQLADVHYVRQGDPRGLGHAVLCARDHVGEHPFAVLLGDDLIDTRDPILPVMSAVQEATGGAVIALLEVDPDHIGLYGCAAVTDAGAVAREAAQAAGGDPGQVVSVVDLVEKPDVGSAPSNLAVIGRYVLPPAIFSILEHTQPGRGNEIQLTDALRELATTPAAAGGGVHGVIFRGRRYDTGDRLDYLKTVVRLASERADLGPAFTAWLIDYARELDTTRVASAAIPTDLRR